MAVFNGIFPVLPGKEIAFKAFAAECAGPRAAGFAEMQATAGTTRETWSLQQTPMGAFVVVWFEGDPERAFGELAADQGAFATWFKAQVLEISGVDLGAPSDDPMPETVLDWSA
jgi:hypothetical protein